MCCNVYVLSSLIGPMATVEENWSMSDLSKRDKWTGSKEEKIFKNHYSKLCSTMVDVVNLLPYFIQEEIIPLDDQEEIKAKPRTKDKVEKLLQYISGPLQAGDVHSFHIMLSIMEEHGTQATRKLASTMKSLVNADVKETG